MSDETLWLICLVGNIGQPYSKLKPDRQTVLGLSRTAIAQYLFNRC